MSFTEAFFLAVIQGLTEFLPVSSSGHLVLFQKLMNFGTPPVLFDILLHFGTLGSILVFFRKEIIDIIKNLKNNQKLLTLLIVASVPAAFFGFFLSGLVENLFNSLVLVGVAWIFGGSIIVSTSKFNKKDVKENTKEIKLGDALFIGFFQSLALFPGISRSGTTISSGLFRNLSRSQAFSFSFLLAIPAIVGATGLQIIKADFSEVLSLVNLLSTLIAGFIGYIALVLLKKALKNEKFYYFGFYCILLGIIVLLFA